MSGEAAEGVSLRTATGYSRLRSWKQPKIGTETPLFKTKPRKSLVMTPDPLPRQGHRRERIENAA
jgi:hypothetical protein